MSASSYLFEFKVNSTLFHNEIELTIVRQKMDENLKHFGFNKIDMPDGGCRTPGFVTTYEREGGCHALLRGYVQGLVTLDIHEYVEENQNAVISEEIMEQLLNQMKGSLMSGKCKRLPAIRRGQPVEVYFPTTDNKLIEYDFDKCVFEADSPYQNIKIMHSPQFGNMLILDDDPNLAESDLAYTQAITGHPHEVYTDKTVLILGGGDGGILHELLKQTPKFVTMVDIDEIVVTAATQFLRGICHDSMDRLKGANYEVLVEDCVPLLERYAKERRKFDFVINDLTAIPCTTQPVGEHWDFLRKILDLSMKVLHPAGRYYTQGNGANMKSALMMYERQLDRLSEPVSFNKQVVCVPSYHELWVFYKICKKPAEPMAEDETV